MKPLISYLTEPSWRSRLKDEFENPYMKWLETFLESEIQAGQVIYPPADHIFEALNHTPFEATKIVILGQDPYHGQGQAHGLSFSVRPQVALPPSLKNIFKEIQADVKDTRCLSGYLLPWAKQGVLLLNAILTVRAQTPLSHQQKGWEAFTDRIVQLLCLRKDPVIFLLWGKAAYQKFNHICHLKQHFVMTAPHPSPLSAYAGFFGCHHFSKANEILLQLNKKPIDWATYSS